MADRKTERSRAPSCQLPMYGKTPYQVYELTDLQNINSSQNKKNSQTDDFQLGLAKDDIIYFFLLRTYIGTVK